MVFLALDVLAIVGAIPVHDVSFLLLVFVYLFVVIRLRRQEYINKKRRGK